MKGLSSKNAILAVFCILILCSCVPAGGLAEFLSDDKVQDFITTIEKVVIINDLTGDNLVGRDGRIEGLNPKKYYMFEKEIDDNEEPVLRYGKYPYPVYATDQQDFGPGGLTGYLGYITRINRGIIFDLANYHTYTVRAAVPFDDNELSRLKYKDDRGSIPFTKNETGISIPDIREPGILDLSGVMTGNYDVIAVLPFNNPKSSPWKWGEKQADLANFKLEGHDTKYDYIFVKELEGGSFDFRVLYVEIGPSDIPLTPINIANIQGVNLPKVGETAVTSITENEQYYGTVSWSPTPPGGKFAGSQVYTATITLYPKTGYTLRGVTGNFFKVSAASATNASDSGVITATFPATSPAVVNIPGIQGVTVPATNGTPVKTITENAQYSGSVTWSPTVPTTGFEVSTSYTAIITLTAKQGYTMQGVATNFFTVAGTSTPATTVIDNPNSATVTAVFPDTNAPIIINIAGIQGVTAPATGGTPKTVITESTQYTGTISWNGNPATFGAGTVYTATITLTAKPGFTLTGVAANFFTVAGATTVNNAASSGVITAVFPATASTIVNIPAIQGVTPPVTGAVPVTTINENAQYSGTVTWNGSPSIFSYKKVYTAIITLTAKPGFTLTGVAANFFTVAGATTVNNAASSGVITAVFPITSLSPNGITINFTFLSQNKITPENPTINRGNFLGGNTVTLTLEPPTTGLWVNVKWHIGGTEIVGNILEIKNSTEFYSILAGSFEVYVTAELTGSTTAGKPNGYYSAKVKVNVEN